MVKRKPMTQGKSARKKHVPITSKHYYGWALDEFAELKKKHGGKKARKIFNGKYE